MVIYKVFGKPDGPHYAHYDLVGGRMVNCSLFSPSSSGISKIMLVCGFMHCVLLVNLCRLLRKSIPVYYNFFLVMMTCRHPIQIDVRLLFLIESD